ncbi:hypothetical protein BSIN_2486 [Burkholderia singularis]|uniref:Uncharacterized protein n=1 Tax=Burkholderia singularis TaxID=1503053 RepID=A0A238H249_9BURK|nr:hypothetical protein BSIN_2486 [Burkholderia singularis]
MHRAFCAAWASNRTGRPAATCADCRDYAHERSLAPPPKAHYCN